MTTRMKTSRNRMHNVGDYTVTFQIHHDHDMPVPPMRTQRVREEIVEGKRVLTVKDADVPAEKPAPVIQKKKRRAVKFYQVSSSAGYWDYEESK